jgi:hypothetical protein
MKSSIEDNFHYSNYLLSDAEFQGIPLDEAQSKERINGSLDKLAKCLLTEENVSNILLGKCVRLVKHHKSLKYYFDVRIILFFRVLFLFSCL